MRNQNKKTRHWKTMLIVCDWIRVSFTTMLEIIINGNGASVFLLCTLRTLLFLIFGQSEPHYFYKVVLIKKCVRNIYRQKQIKHRMSLLITSDNSRLLRFIDNLLFFVGNYHNRFWFCISYKAMFKRYEFDLNTQLIHKPRLMFLWDRAK